jgi:hypothetical protein
MTDYNDARSLMEEIHDYARASHAGAKTSLQALYYGKGYPEIRSWKVREYDGELRTEQAIAWQATGSGRVGDVVIDKYVLHHSGELAMPLLHFYKPAARSRNLVFWFSSKGKAGMEDWEAITKYVNAGSEVISFDFRGLGETRMPYKAVSPDDPGLGRLSYDEAYGNSLSSVLAGYVYNSLLIGRPYFLQMVEDMEIATRFAQSHCHAARISVVGEGDSAIVARAAGQVLSSLAVSAAPDSSPLTWMQIVNEKRELWPIQYLVPDGARLAP